ncbi:MAG: LPS export ABC transporter periplasmic protein LptC [Prevotella sp.]|nr:LPS export ABC transporter periplasmic protein LptC [Prevotella sp.]
MESRVICTSLLAVFCAATLFVLLGCEEEKEHTAPAIHDRDSVSVMTSYGVNTLISDSGVIKYRIVTERWDVNTARKPSRWEFMKGIFFEQFDQQFHTEGYIQADTAWYFDQLKLWKLRGRVRIRNVSGLVYTSEELFWDGLRHEFYSNVFSRIVTPERTLQGTYFRSDEHMSHYTVSNSKGSFTTESMEKEDNNTPKDTTQQQQVPLRPQAVKHAKTNVTP